MESSVKIRRSNGAYCGISWVIDWEGEKLLPSGLVGEVSAFDGIFRGSDTVFVGLGPDQISYFSIPQLPCFLVVPAI